MTVITLKAKSFTKSAFEECVEHMPTVMYKRKKALRSAGTFYYFYDAKYRRVGRLNKHQDRLDLTIVNPIP